MKRPDTKKELTQRLRVLLPDLYWLLRPHLGLLMIGIACIFLNRICAFVLPASVKYLVDHAFKLRSHSALIPLILLFGCAGILEAISGFGIIKVLSLTADGVVAELRCKVYAHMLRLPASFFDSNTTGSLMAHVMEDTKAIRELVATGLKNFVGNAISLGVAVIFFLATSPLLGALVVIMIAGCALVLKRACDRLRRLYDDLASIHSEVTGRLAESLSGIRTIKGYVAESREEGTFRKGSDRLRMASLKVQNGTAWTQMLTVASTSIATLLVMYIGSYAVVSGTLSLGTFMTFLILFGFLTGPMIALSNVSPVIAEALTSIERTKKVLEQIPEEDCHSRCTTIAIRRGTVRFEDVSFSYDGKNLVLRDVSFTSESGSVTALVGPSGAGKSTLVALLAAFYLPCRGRITVDNTDLSTVRLSSYRSQLAFVMQETFLFNGTIRDNVAFSRPQATKKEISEACRLAHIYDLPELPEGYNTIVGERGVKLSGGQKQRVAIARAVLADPRILIMDEATASLDSETEWLIQESLRSLVKNRTTFIIAHRLSTIQHAERILYLDAGKLVDSGSHSQLLKSCFGYRGLHERQTFANRTF